MSGKVTRVVLTTSNTQGPEGTFPIVQGKTSFQMVSEMNAAFGNPKGIHTQIDWTRLQNQCKNIKDEFNELMEAIAAKDLDKTRDALCDIHVFTYGAHHLIGLDADDDMKTVVDAVMTRFIKNEEDKLATIAKHAAKGVTEVYFEGDYPKMVMKSSCDQTDAPKGKFLKSASFMEPVFP